MSGNTILPKDLKVLSFDLDDTFWDCAPAIAHAERSLYRWHKKNTPRIVQHHDEASLLAFRVQVRQRNPGLCGCVTAMRLQGLRELLEEFSYPAEWAEEAFEVFYRARSQVVLYSGVIDLLEELGTRYALAAITNGNADLDRIGIAHYFDRIYAADLEMKAKPDADMFRRCTEHFKVNSAQIMHIGDNPVADIHGGIIAGVQTLWFNQHALEWPHADYSPDYEVRSIRQMKELLR